MKKFWLENRPLLIFLIVLILLWRTALFVPQIIGKNFLQRIPTYIGVSPWMNMDGMHYISIAEQDYVTYEQAFFPLFPLLIRFTAMFFNVPFFIAGIVLVHMSLLVALFFFWKLLRFDYDKKRSLWSLLFLIAFPTTFFLGSIYTESMFLMFVFSSLYFARKGNFLTSGFLGMFASATRLAGIFLFFSVFYEAFLLIRKNNQQSKSKWLTVLPLFLIPLGLLSYMAYLWKVYNDPVLFVHVQSAFNAGRTGGELISLPQVLWRYSKIFLTVPIFQYIYWVSVLEFTSFIISVFLLFQAFRNKVRKSYLVFSLNGLMLPTLTGTFLSMPRFTLTFFPIFIMLAGIKNNRLKYSVIMLCLLLQLLLTMFFVQGYFVS